MAIISSDKKHHSVLTQGELDNITNEMMDAMSPEELAVLQLLLESPDTLGAFQGLDYDREVLGPEEWLENPYYSGVYGRSMYDPLKQDLCDIVNGSFFEIIMTGALGTGKTYLGRAVTVYNLYRLSCLKSPQKFWGLSETTKLAFVSIGINKAQIAKVVFGEFGPELDTIDYFKYDHKIIGRSQEHGFTFEKNLIIRPGGSSEGDVIGEAVFGAVIDEINFRSSEKGAIDKAKKSKGISPTDKLVDAVRARIESRFQRGHILGGFIHISSSKRSEHDFTEKRAVSRANDPSVFIRDRSIWEVKDKKNYSGKKFKVFVGTAGIPSEVLTDERYEELKDNMPEGCLIIEVPVEHASQFSEGRDIDQAIRDVAGVSTIGFDKFFKDRYALDEMFAVRLPQYLTNAGGAPVSGNVVFGTPLEIPAHNFACDSESGKPYKVLRHPKARRVAHIDVALTGDALGLSIGHIVDYVNVPVYDYEHGDMIERMPRVEMDLTIGFSPPKNGEIILERIRGLIYQLRSMGMPIWKITMDSFQCLTYETPVFVVGHGILPIGEIASRFQGQEFYVISKDLKTNELTYAKAKNARRTGTQVGNLISVFYNNGRDRITCTLDHPILMKSGEYVKARNLKSGDEIDSAFRTYEWENLDEVGLRNKLYTDKEKNPQFPVIREILKCVLNYKSYTQYRSNKFNVGILDDENLGAIIEKNIPVTEIKKLLDDWDGVCKRLRDGFIETNTPQESSNFYKMNRTNVKLKENKEASLISHILSDFGLSEISLFSPDHESYKQVKSSVFGRGFRKFRPIERSDLIDFKVSDVITTNRVADVYDIEVPTYQNFCLGSGIIVHNSRDSLQVFREKGYEAELLSVDKTSEPYDTLKRAILERRIKSNPNAYLKDEILGLEKDEKTGKIDHGVNTSKDISDSVAGVVQTLTQEKETGMPQFFRGDDGHRSRNIETNWLINSEIKRDENKPTGRKNVTKVFF